MIKKNHNHYWLPSYRRKSKRTDLSVGFTRENAAAVIPDHIFHRKEKAPFALLTELFTNLGQTHLLEELGSMKNREENAENLLAQLESIAENIPGGLDRYCSRSRKLLKEAGEGVNPYQDYEEIEKVEGVDLTSENGPGSLQFEEYF